jgi:hypothetical protein
MTQENVEALAIRCALTTTLELGTQGAIILLCRISIGDNVLGEYQKCILTQLRRPNRLGKPWLSYGCHFPSGLTRRGLGRLDD